ncbi:MAG: TfoX/Sxy family protein [Actinobacteria bacterium]|nr:TfoX/Sxy family protein [Actinomycetota bacterium]
MAYDERLADEIRERLAGVDGEVEEKRMFGGLGFMVDGNLAVAASRRGGLLVRTDPEDAEEVLALSGAEPMEMRGRKMPGWVFVAPDALAGEAELDAWVDRALAFVATLPAK